MTKREMRRPIWAEDAFLMAKMIAEDRKKNSIFSNIYRLKIEIWLVFDEKAAKIAKVRMQRAGKAVQDLKFIPQMHFTTF